MIDGRVQGWLIFLFYVLILVEADGLYAEIKYIESAVAKGAVCLDGSPPAYHFDKGFGSGINNWLVHIEGGGWCHNITKCLARKNTRLGSSKQMEKQLAFSGILINKGQYNPDFYNWNRVKIGYCDGASFTGDVEEVDPANNLYFRGARIWVAVMEELLANGMSNAENALLSGCSAGGLTTILHCDSFRALLPMGTKVKCLSDGGYFINANDISGIPHMRAYFNEVATLHGSAKNLPQSCTLSMKPSMCFFPQYIVEKIRTPLFILNSAYDSWQVMHFQIRNILAPGDADPRDHWHYFMLDIKPTIRNILAPSDADPHDHWHYCKLDMKQCSPSQLATIQVFRLEFLSALARLGSSLSRGMFINSCFAHCQSELQGDWLWPDSPLLNKTTIAKAVGDWFYDRNPFQMIDCPYPCDMSCQRHQVFHPQEL